MVYQTCKTCSYLKPRVEPHYSLYGSGQAKRRQWKHVCNDCIERAAVARVRKPAAPSLDSRDRRHPLEDVMHEWRAEAAL